MRLNKISAKKKFRNSYHQFIDKIRNDIFYSEKKDEIVELARWYGALEYINKDGVYEDSLLENDILKKVQKEDLFLKYHLSDKKTLLASELYDYGGHTAVVLKWLKKSKNHQLIVTGKISPEAKQYLKNEQILFYVCQKKGTEKIEEIIQFSKESRSIILHIHPNDIVASIASLFLKKNGTKCIFYNHSDHTFSYGIGVADIVCEISTFGEKLSQRTCRSKGIQYRLGIPLASKNIPASKNKNHIMITCGSSWKYKPDTHYSFPSFLEKVLSRISNLDIILVGPRGNEPWWKSIKKRWSQRVTFAGPTPKSKYIKLLKASTIYVDSFPVTGGTAFPEAIINGKLASGIYFSAGGYSLADELKEKNIESLIDRVLLMVKNDKGEVQKNNNIRKKILEQQSTISFYKRIEVLYNPGRLINLKNMRFAKVPTDTFYYEKQWCNARKIYLPLPGFYNLPFHIRIKYLFYSIRIMYYTKKQDVLKMIAATFLGNKYQTVIVHLKKKIHNN
jgi:hypothetical protein